MRTRAVLITAAALLAAGLLLAACGTSGSATSTSPSSPQGFCSAGQTWKQGASGNFGCFTNAATASSSAPATDTSGPSPFGRAHAWTYDDGLSVQVVRAVPTTVGPYASGGSPGDPAVIIYVRVTAGGKPYDASQLSVDANGGPDGTQLEAVFDTGIDNPAGTVTPGSHGTYKFEFDAQHTSWERHLAVTVTPGFDYNAASFTGAAA
jgi:hypothetical protein